MVSHNGEIVTLDPNKGVLILIVMDNGLSLAYRDEAIFGGGLNPYCNG